MSKVKKIDYDPYKVLECDPSTSENGIDKAYKKLALKWHPDKAEKNGITKEKAEEMFIKIYQAYEFLKDTTNRTHYDDQIAAKKRRQDFDDKRKAESNARRQHFVDKLNEKEAAFENRKRKSTPGSSHFNLDKELERLRKEGAEYLARMAEQSKPKEQPKPVNVLAPSEHDHIYKMNTKSLSDLEEEALAGL